MLIMYICIYNIHFELRCFNLIWKFGHVEFGHINIPYRKVVYKPTILCLPCTCCSHRAVSTMRYG